ncbi:MAG: carboxypeptidase regulatory-like domain-containing protein [Armatimonadetes bacterium]|nr:carboxypeptidase regulatory-like domain-containing protein [Armatimonadota bacterium]
MALSLIALPARAGDPLIRNVFGDGVGWNPNAPVPVFLFGGDMPKVPHAAIRAELQDAVTLWKSVPRSRLDLRYMGALPGPLTPLNFDANVFKNPNTPGDLTPLREAILIVPDVEGRLLDDIQPGLSNGVLGLAWPIKQSTDPYLRLSVVYLNGKLVTPGNIALTLRHEIGHALGLAHMEANVDCGQLVPPLNGAGCDEIPLMRRGSLRTLSNTPTLDDYATLAGLYPASTPGGETGTVEGRLTLRSSQQPVPGAVVVARNVEDPRRVAVSSVTAISSERRGRYKIAGLPPGEYRIDVAPIVALSEGGGDSLGDLRGPFPTLKSPAAFFVRHKTVESPLASFLLRVEAGKAYTVDLIQDDLKPASQKPPEILSAAALRRGDTLYAQVEFDNPNGEPIALWEKRIGPSGESLNPGVWLWDQANSLGRTKPVLHMTFSAKDTSRLADTRSLQVYPGGTRRYTRLNSALPDVTPDQFVNIPVTAEPAVGDVDLNGSFALGDVILTMKSIVGQADLSMLQRMQADLSPLPGAQGRLYGNGQVDLSDVITLLRRLVGLESGPLTGATPMQTLPDPSETDGSTVLDGAVVPATHPRGGLLIP